MKVRWLALALAAMLAPAAAPAATILNLAVDGGGAQAVPSGGVVVNPGAHSITLSITPDPVGKLAGYVMNLEAGGGATFLSVGGALCTNARPGASDNCTSTGTPTAIGTAETLGVSITNTVNLITFQLDLSAGGALSLANSSSVVLDDFSELAAQDLLGANLTLVSAIPEPGTVLLLGAGLAGLAVRGRKRA